ncbi:hypothetical protein Tco_0033488 [Tanacetum coccineum]
MKSQQLTNAFVKETFMDLKTQLETVAKNHQASIQNLETKFDRLADKQSGRPSRSLPSNTQPNLKGHTSKAYQPPQSCNEHMNAIFTRSGKSYNPPKWKKIVKFHSFWDDPFFHTADAVIQVKQKQLNLRVGTERMIFNIDSAMKHSYSNDDTFSVVYVTMKSKKKISTPFRRNVVKFFIPSKEPFSKKKSLLNLMNSWQLNCR